MKDFFSGLGVFIFVLLVVGLITWVIIHGTESGKTYEKTDIPMNEWVSPDGVHYWYHDGAYGESFLAPRYDKMGKLVID